MIDHLDHLVLTTSNETACIEFYPRVLGMHLDLCFIASSPLEAVIAKLNAANEPIIGDPVIRTGATQTISSVYVRDPDLNLIEISELVVG
jgi:catechol 2,3-dioxygenase-like lactoylglutathione lyase family enzyme